MVQMVSARPYQHEAKENMLKAYKNGTDSGIVHLATGAGKSFVNVMFSREAFDLSAGQRILCIGGINQDLVWQMAENYQKHWPEINGNIWVASQNRKRQGIGVVMGKMADNDAAVICASIQTLIGAEELRGQMGQPPREMSDILPTDIVMTEYGGVALAPNSERRWLVSKRLDQILYYGLLDYIAHDEAHHAPSDGSVVIYRRIEQVYKLVGRKPVFKVGFTATPERQDGRALGTIYSKILFSRDMMWMIRHNYCADFETPPALRVVIPKVTNEAGEERESSSVKGFSMQAVSNWDEIIVDSWLENAKGRPTVAYVGQHTGPNHIEDSIRLSKTFNKKGVRAVHIDGLRCIDQHGKQQPKSKRKEYYHMLRTGQLDVICNYDVIAEGVDIAPVSCILIARSMNPTDATQCIGRATRILPNKAKTLVLVCTDQDLILSDIATLTGSVVDPQTKTFELDIDLDEYLQYFVLNYTERPEIVIMWKNMQQFYSKETVDRAIATFMSDTAALAVDKTQVKILKILVEFYRDEDALFGEINLKDKMQKDGLIQGTDKIYKIVDILRSSQALWHSDPQTHVMTCPIGEGHAMLIHPPSYGRADSVRLMLHEVQKALSGEETDFYPAQGQDKESLTILKEVLQMTHEFYSNFTGWHICTENPFKPYIVGESGWVCASPHIDVIESDAMRYARECEEIYSKALSKKKQNWHRDEASVPQLNLLARLLGIYGRDDAERISKLPHEYHFSKDRSGNERVLRKVEAAKYITAMSAPKALLPILEASAKRVEILEQYL